VSRLTSSGSSVTDQQNFDNEAHWSDEAIMNVVYTTGNKSANEHWEYSVPQGKQKPISSSDLVIKEAWIHSKYIKKEFSLPKEGYVSVKEGREWRHQLLTISLSSLNLHSTQQQHHLSGSNSIDLLSCTVIGSIHNEYFVVFTSPGKRYLVNATTNQNAMSWVNAIKGASERLMSIHCWFTASATFLQCYLSPNSSADLTQCTSDSHVAANEELIRQKKNQLDEIMMKKKSLRQQKQELEEKLRQIHTELEMLSYKEEKLHEELMGLKGGGSLNSLDISKDGLLQSATIDRIIELLISSPAQLQCDSDLLSTFLITYRLFMSPCQLLERLISAFHSNISSREMACNLIKAWLDRNGFEFEEASLRLAVSSFLETPEMASWAEDLRERLGVVKPRGGLSTREEHTTFGLLKRSIPEPIIPKRLTGHFDQLLDFDSCELARQLSLIDHTLYQLITPVELLLSTRGAEKQAHLSALIERNELVQGWVKSEILKEQLNTQRVRLLEKFVGVASFCREIGNFNGVVTIVTALNHPSIRRLTKLWSSVSPKLRSVVEALERLISEKDGYSGLHQAINSNTHPACVPFIGMFLYDLVELNSTPDLLSSNEEELSVGRAAVNLVKTRIVSLVLRQFLQHQKPSYLFKAVPEIEQFLRNISGIGDRECFALSYLHQPRSTTISHPISSSTSSSSFQRTVLCS